MNGTIIGKNTLKTKVADVSLVLTGIGPGLFFMAFGGFILVVALFYGGAETTISKESSTKTGSVNEEISSSTKGVRRGFTL